MSDHLRRAFERYRDEDKHECNLLTGRVNALLVSQAFFAAAASAIYESRRDNHFTAIHMIIVVAFAIVFVTSCAICIGCQVLNQWHAHGMRLIARDHGGALQGYYLSQRRNQPDLRHHISVDVFAIGISIALGVGWLCAFALTAKKSLVALIIIAAVGVLWVIALRACWILSTWPTPLSCREKIAAIFFCS